MSKLIIIGGTTASKKSDYAIHLAKKLNGEIISADSMQIYKYMDIGTAKISKTEMQGVPHHLIDFVDPKYNFSVSEWKSKAESTIEDIINRGHQPIVVGGTGLYINSLIYNMSYGGTEANEALRAKLNEEYDIIGKELMYKKLCEIDPLSAQKLHINDKKRIVRALEIIMTTGISKQRHEHELNNKYDIELFALTYNRELLYENINMRVDKMIEKGLLDEVKSLLSLGLTFDMQSMKAIGYREWSDYFNGVATLDETIEMIKKGSRNYAKRQLTWFRKYNNLIWLNPLEESLWK